MYGPVAVVDVVVLPLTSPLLLTVSTVIHHLNVSIMFIKQSHHTERERKRGKTSECRRVSSFAASGCYGQQNVTEQKNDANKKMILSQSTFDLINIVDFWLMKWLLLNFILKYLEFVK